MAEMSNDWRVVAEQASREQDSERLIKLAHRMVDLLQEEQNRKKPPTTP